MEWIEITVFALPFSFRERKGITAFKKTRYNKKKNQCYAWEKPSGDIVVQNQIIYMHQQNMHTMHYCYPTIIWICLLANKFQEKLHLIVIERGELSS